MKRGIRLCLVSACVMVMGWAGLAAAAEFTFIGAGSFTIERDGCDSVKGKSDDKWRKKLGGCPWKKITVFGKKSAYTWSVPGGAGFTPGSYLTVKTKFHPVFVSSHMHIRITGQLGGLKVNQEDTFDWPEGNFRCTWSGW